MTMPNRISIRLTKSVPIPLSQKNRSLASAKRGSPFSNRVKLKSLTKIFVAYLRGPSNIYSRQKNP